MLATGMIAGALTGNNPVPDEFPDDLVHRTGNPTNNLDSLLLEKLHSFHSHTPCKDMRNPAGCEQPWQFSGFVAWVQHDLMMKDFFVPDMVYCKFFAMAKVRGDAVSIDRDGNPVGSIRSRSLHASESPPHSTPTGSASASPHSPVESSTASPRGAPTAKPVNQGALSTDRLHRDLPCFCTFLSSRFLW